MTDERDDLGRFRDAFLDYLEGFRDQPPRPKDLPERHRQAAESFVDSIMAARGVDPYASRPSIEQLLTSRSPTSDQASELGDALQSHLRLTVDHKAVVARDAASAAFGLASALVIQARGMRIRVVPETTSLNLDYALAKRAEDIAMVFSAFPESHAVLYTTTGQEPHAVVVDRSDVREAIETPSGEVGAPRLRRLMADPGTACEEWLTKLIPEFRPLGTELLETRGASEADLDPYQLAIKVVSEVSAAGSRARIGAKQETWTGFGDCEAERLADLVQKAQRGQLSEKDYESCIDELVEMGA